MLSSRLASLLILLLFVSCKSNSFREGIAKGELKIINIPEERVITPLFEDYISDITLIPLETKKESVFSEIEKLFQHNNKFYIFDNTLQEVLIFSSDGSFIEKLNRRGKGDQEYIEMRDFELDNDGNFYVLSYNSIYIYDSNKKFKEKIQIKGTAGLNINPLNFAFADNGGFYLWSGSFSLHKPEENQYAACKIDRSGNLTGEVYFPVKNALVAGNRFSKINTDGSYGMTPYIGNDSIYRFENSKVYPAYYLNFGNRKLPRDYYLEWNTDKKVEDAFNNTNYVVAIHHFIETDNFIYFLQDSKKTGWPTICSKKTGNVFCFEYYANENDFPVIRSGEGNHLIGGISSYSLLAAFKDGSFTRKFRYLKSYDELENKIKKLQENDNHLLMVLKMKEF